MKKTLVRSLAMAFVGSLLVAGSAMALPTLTLFDGTTTKIIADGSSSDSNSLPGEVTFVGNLGTWYSNVTTGLSPAGPGVPNMDLNSVDRSDGAGTLKITFSDIMSSVFSAPGIAKAIGGTINQTGNSVSYETFIDGTSYGPSLNFTSPSSPYGFSGANAYGVSSTSSSLVDLVVTITHKGAGTTSFDATVAPVPEPATMLLLGSGLVGLAGAGARRRKAKKA